MNAKQLIKKLQKFNHGSQGIAYNISAVNVDDYNKVYLEFCNMYDCVNQDHVKFPLFDNKMSGYVLCK